MCGVAVIQIQENILILVVFGEFIPLQTPARLRFGFLLKAGTAPGVVLAAMYPGLKVMWIVR